MFQVFFFLLLLFPVAEHEYLTLLMAKCYVQADQGCGQAAAIGRQIQEATGH